MLKIEIDLWPILYGIIFLIIYMSFTNIKRKKNNEDINNVNITNIECTCQTFFIDESELKNCNHCINKHLKFLEESNKKRKKCLSFPN